MKEKKDKSLPMPDFVLENRKPPIHIKILQFIDDMYSNQNDVSVTLIDNRFTIMGSMISKKKEGEE